MSQRLNPAVTGPTPPATGTRASAGAPQGRAGSPSRAIAPAPLDGHNTRYGPGLGAMSRHLTRWLTGPVFGWHDVGMADIAWALLLSVFGVASVTGLTNPTNHGGLGAALAVLLMTAPVAWARRQPVGGRGCTGGGGLFELGFV